MAKPCSVCTSPNRADIECAVSNRTSNRETARQFGISASALGRHRAHADIAPPDRLASHLAASEELIAAVKVIRGSDFSAQDQAEAQHLRSLAEAVDASPSNIAALRELRITLDGFRHGAFRADPSEQLELAELVATLSGHRMPGRSDQLYRRVYDSVIEAGGTPDQAEVAAGTANGHNMSLPSTGFCDGVPL